MGAAAAVSLLLLLLLPPWAAAGKRGTAVLRGRLPLLRRPPAVRGCFPPQVRWASYTGGCGSTSSLPSWTRITIGVICGLIAVALLFTAFRMCTRRRPAPPAVQLGPMPPPQTGPQGYYTGSAAYPPQPGQGYAGQGYAGAGAWGSQPYPPAPAGYTSYGSGGYGGGYGGAPTTPHVPPPMQTVVLGSPGAEAPPAPAAAPAGAGTGAAAAPASGGAPASGNPFSDSGAKV